MNDENIVHLAEARNLQEIAMGHYAEERTHLVARCILEVLDEIITYLEGKENVD